MIRNRLYYRFKPLIPAPIRLAVRGWVARGTLRQSRGIWPILPGSEKTPADWPGWPGGKKFALVLTHDIENASGLAKSRQLMEIDKKWGFRSSFNFVPEGDYRVSRELREDLAREGFEVGVHDLHHDGKLYHDREEFAVKAVRINDHLKTWGAGGFRSGFMFHNLEWLEDLNIEYDASTFDTDPFEPQPDEAGTIFPFWCAGARGRGFVELPYTLPQDSTLFLVLGERGSAIWRQKLDWIVSHRGMALLNVHPDYIDFDGGKPQAGHYPLAYYEEFLKHIATTYRDAYWNPVPRELAAWYKSTRSETKPAQRAAAAEAKPLAEPKHAAVVLFAFYATDARPRREAEALVNEGYEVDVISIRINSSDPAREMINGVNVVLAPLRHRRGGKLNYFLEYGFFFLYSFLLLAKWSLKKKYKVVHVHNMPDFLVFSALVPRLRGAKLILDLHDPMPELFASMYGVSPEHFASRLLRRIEKWSTGFADLVITPNLAFKELFASRSCPADKIEIVMNTPEAEIFHPYAEVPTAAAIGVRPFKLMYHGLLVERHGLDLAIAALAAVRGKIPQIELHFYGEDTDFMHWILEEVKERKLEGAVYFHGFKSLQEIAEAIGTMDLGLIPNRLSPFTQINLPTRIFEYLAVNKPVIVPRTQGIADYFKDDEILYFEPGKVDDLARQIEWVYEHPTEARLIMERGQKVYEKYSWELERGRFNRMVEGLTGKREEPARKPKRICMVTYSYYLTDARVARYAETLAARGDEVDVISLERWQDKQGAAESKVNVVRLQSRFKKEETSPLSYLLPVLRFFCASFFWIARHHSRKPYDLLHIHNVPDFLVFTAAYPKLSGAKVILDIHDIVPEFYASKFSGGEKSAMQRMLKLTERLSARFSNHVIMSNQLWLDKYAARTGTTGRCSVFINNVDTAIFRPRARTRHDGKFVIIFPGGLQWHQGLDIALRAFERVSREAPQAEFHIYGDGSMKKSLMELAQELGLNGKVRFFDPVPVSAIAEVMANADLGVVPKRADSFGNEAYSTKIMEFMSLGIPVVVSSTKIDRFYFNDSVVCFFESGNVEALASALLKMIGDRSLREEMAQRALDYAIKNSWDSRKLDYLNLVDSLCAKAPRDGEAARRPKLVEA